jgi:hypothetical protein
MHLVGFIIKKFLHTIYNSAFPSDILFLVGIYDYSYYATDSLYYYANGMMNPPVTWTSLCSWGLVMPCIGSCFVLG